MLRTSAFNKIVRIFNLKNNKNYSTEISFPPQADVVVIGGGVIGCNTLYQLSKRGVNAVLLEKCKITSGTTWHTNGLVWRLRPNDVEIQLLNATRNLVLNIENETGINPGWVNNGGIFISRSEERLNEYKRLHTIGHLFGIESQILSALETAQLFPLLNTDSFNASLYSPGDGILDPTMFCNSLIKGAKQNGAQIFENCNAKRILLEPNTGINKVIGVETNLGTIKTSCVLNSCGAWSRNIAKMVGLDLPITTMKHAYVVTAPIEGINGLPNIRDHDASVCLKTMGNCFYIGGYEENPDILKEVPEEFAFELYNLEFSLFDNHIKKMTELCPIIEKVGIKTSICGPESFTPDHRPILGEDPRVHGLFHGCGFNSAGMMLSGGCAEQLAIWITKGRPDLPMFSYDIRRFTPSMRTDRTWITETSHESYAKNYGIVFPNMQPLAGRNHKIDPFHASLVANGAIMGQAQGWERPEFFITNNTAPVRQYDWYGNYDNIKHEDNRYEKQLEGDYTFGFSKHHNLIGQEALAARNNAALFNFSYFCKLYLTGPNAEEAANWLFTASIDNNDAEKIIYSCALNERGGIESYLTVTPLSQGVGTLVGPILKGKGYYLVGGGASGYQTISHLKKHIEKKNFRATITDVSDKMGILSIQGPKSREILQSITESPITDEKIPVGTSVLLTINGHICRAMRVTFIGELGFELHIPLASCISVYNKIVEAGRSFDMIHGGFRALFSLNCEKGFHLWHRDLRTDDNPIEANLGHICSQQGSYLGKESVEKLRNEGTTKLRTFFVLEDKVPLYGLETVWRDGKIVGFLRRGDYGHFLDKSIGIGYLKHPDGKKLEEDFLKSGKYEIEVMDRRYPAKMFLRSPFDPKNERIRGHYEHLHQELTHFED